MSRLRLALFLGLAGAWSTGCGEFVVESELSSLGASSLGESSLMLGLTLPLGPEAPRQWFSASGGVPNCAHPTRTLAGSAVDLMRHPTRPDLMVVVIDNAPVCADNALGLEAFVLPAVKTIAGKVPAATTPPPPTTPSSGATRPAGAAAAGQPVPQGDDPVPITPQSSPRPGSSTTARSTAAVVSAPSASAGKGTSASSDEAGDDPVPIKEGD